MVCDITSKKFEDDKKDGLNKLEIIEEETKNYLDDMKKGTYNIMVAVRCRPLWTKEKEFSEYEIVKILDRKMVILMDPYEYNAPGDIFKNRSREQTMAFDFAFDKTCNQVKQQQKINLKYF
jgi:kinesin family protein 18/19